MVHLKGNRNIIPDRVAPEVKI